MLATLPDFLQEYWKYLAGVVLFCAVASYFSKKFFLYLKKTSLIIVILFTLTAGYEMVIGRSIFRLPGDIDTKLSEDPSNPETGRRYYQSYKERFGEEVPRD